MFAAGKTKEGRAALAAMKAAFGDRFYVELQRHGLDACEREVRWLEELITNERSGRTPAAPAGELHLPADAAGDTSPEVPRPPLDRP